MGDVGEHWSEGERTQLVRVHEAEAIKRDGSKEADEGGELSERPRRASRSADLEEDVTTGKGGANEARKREGRREDRSNAREENEEMPLGETSGREASGRGGRPGADEDV